MTKHSIRNVVSTLESELVKLIENGYCYFGAGGALGFDTVAAQTVLHLKEKYPHTRVETPPSTSATEQSSSAETNSPPTTATTTEPETGDTEPKDSEDKEPTASAPTVPQASASDCKTIASKIVEYVNAYRSEEGVAAATVLPGLTTYAEYRSRQLVSNFAHDTADERAAATALQYGEYVDPPLYGMTGDPYYTVNACEAIAKAGYSGTADDVARKLTNLVHSSSSHWNYVGGDEYVFIAVGVTYESGIWYCDIAVTHTNTDNST